MDYQERKERLNNNREKIRQRMIDIARQKDLISYGELFKEWLDMNDVSDRDLASQFLGGIGEEEYNVDRPMLTAIVILNTPGEITPGAGFFGLAENLGFPISKTSSKDEKMEFFSNQLKEVYSYWSQDKEQS